MNYLILITLLMPVLGFAAQESALVPLSEWAAPVGWENSLHPYEMFRRFEQAYIGPCNDSYPVECYIASSLRNLSGFNRKLIYMLFVSRSCHGVHRFGQWIDRKNDFYGPITDAQRVLIERIYHTNQGVFNSSVAKALATHGQQTSALTVSGLPQDLLNLVMQYKGYCWGASTEQILADEGSKQVKPYGPVLGVADAYYTKPNHLLISDISGAEQALCRVNDGSLELDISGNLLEQIDLGKLWFASKINASNNMVDVVRFNKWESGQKPVVEELDLSYNQLAEVPSALYLLPKLRKLKLYGNYSIPQDQLDEFRKWWISNKGNKSDDLA